MERMYRIHQALQRNDYPNCHKLSVQLEVVKRTIMRDLEFMKSRLRLPIAYDERRWGFYYTEPVLQFPDLPVSEAEAFALMIAHKAIAQYQGTPFHRLLERAFRTLTGRLDDETRFTMGNLDAALSFRPFAPEDADLETFEVLTQGVRDRREVTFEYRNLGTQAFRKRQVQPRHLACIDNRWYLFAFDVQRQAMRTFVLGRLRKARLLATRFTADRRFDLNEYLRGSLAVFKGGEDYQVVVDFDAWAADLTRGRRWHSSQERTELAGGKARLRLRLNSLEEAEQWVLGWGTHATVTEPRALVERIRKTSTEVVRRCDRLLSRQGGTQGGRAGAVGRRA
jgi:proteasome accessory factor B